MPYFPEDGFYCGPQSLASVLSAAGVNVDPTELINDLYVPGRRGTFAPEIQAEARDRGRMPYRVEPRLEALVDALDDGFPVLILQNLGLGFAPTWHYAVVIGYDRPDDVFILRTGPHQRRTIPTANFERRWRLGDYWGLVMLAPDDFPVWVKQREYERQLAYLESSWRADLFSIYQRTLDRWPRSAAANLGLGNWALAAGEPQQASAHYRSLLEYSPDNIAALNNLAEAENRLGHARRAMELACRAQDLAQGHPLLPVVNATVDELSVDAGGLACPPPE